MSPSRRRPNAELPKVAGVKRPAPSALLPAFEPSLPSSPCLPPPAKRRIHNAPSTETESVISKYPTPVPTSSTGILSSSPPNLPRARPGLHRTASTVSERAPLSTVPTITLPVDGEAVLMGRSSNSSHFQLSANRLISRVHVRAMFIPGATTPLGISKVEVVCLGWNGIKVHCQGRTWSLGKGDSFTSDKEQDIMVDVQDARVLLSWPRHEPNRSMSNITRSTPELNSSPKSAASPQEHHASSSPFGRGQPPESPVSPTPVRRGNFPSSSTLMPSDPTLGHDQVVSVYEDEPGSDDHGAGSAPATQPTQQDTQPLFNNVDGDSQLSAISVPQEFSDQDEENDPIIVSFGPQGENLLPRMASFTTAESPLRALRRSQRVTRSPRQMSGQVDGSGSATEDDSTSLANHVVNQLAFSRLSSTPLSTVLNNLPGDIRGDTASKTGKKHVTPEELKTLLESLACVGSVTREGKDAAGKALESEYYYLPELDADEMRREAVVNSLRKPGLRACRKQHKVCRDDML